MVRTHWMSLAAATAIGLACGCTSFCNHPWFGRFRGASARDYAGCDIGGAPVCDGPMLGDAGPVVVTPNGRGATVIPPSQGAIVPAPTTPQSTMPPLTPPPRLVPEPQSQTTPYAPSKNKR